MMGYNGPFESVFLHVAMAAAYRKDRLQLEFFRIRSIFITLNRKLIDILISKLEDGRLLDMCVCWTIRRVDDA